MENLCRLPPHRFRLNALLSRELGEMRSHREVRDRLWSEGEAEERCVNLPFRERGPRAFAMDVVRLGPERSPNRVRLSLGLDHSLTTLRFEAQRMTLESAVDAHPSLWGAAGHIVADLERIQGGELRGLVLTAVRQLATGGSMLDPWCGAARLLVDDSPQAAGRAYMTLHPLRALRAALNEGLHDPTAFLAQTVLASLVGWRGAPLGDPRQPREGRLDLVVVGDQALALCRELGHDNAIRVVRAADESAVYTPSEAILEDGRRALVSTGPFDMGVLTEPADVLVLLPGAPEVDRGAAEFVGASVVLETGPNLILPEADATLTGRRVEVIPDLLFAAAEPMACGILQRSTQRRVVEARQRLSIEVARLVREVLVAAGERGRSLRDQLYLRALGNLQR